MKLIKLMPGENPPDKKQLFTRPEAEIELLLQVVSALFKNEFP